MAGTSYSEGPEGPIRHAYRLRAAGLSYERIAETLRDERRDCERLTATAVRRWATAGRLSWDDLIDADRQARVTNSREAAAPEVRSQLEAVRNIVKRGLLTLYGGEGGDQAPYTPDECKLYKINLSTMKQWLEMERQLTGGRYADLQDLPPKLVQAFRDDMIGLVAGAIIALGGASEDWMKGHTKEIAKHIEDRLPDVLRMGARREALDAAD